MRHPATAIVLLCSVTVSACGKHQQAGSASGNSLHMDHGEASTAMTAPSVVPNDTTLPPDAAGALARLNASPRHGQYVMIPTTGGDSIQAWIVYPSRSTRAPVVVVVHEIFGLSTWVRAVTDQLAAAGYIAIAPDLLSGQRLPGAPDSVSVQAGVAAVSKLNPADVQRQLDATAAYATGLPAALPKYGIIGFCWGGGVAFEHTVHTPKVRAAVVYYGTSPKTATLASITAPVFGVYGENDARVVTTIPPADSALQAIGKTFTHHVYPGATHGFLRDQAGGSGANLAATRQAWPATVEWFQKYLGS